jgi:acetyltransferase-like isoleucine patch superfamily enzyme
MIIGEGVEIGGGTSIEARACMLFRREERFSRIQVHGSLRLGRGKGILRVGPRVTFGGGLIPTFLATRSSGTISIGEGCYLNYGVALDASVSITLGIHCVVGSMVVLRDDDGRSACRSWSETGSGLRTVLS